ACHQPRGPRNRPPGPGQAGRSALPPGHRRAAGAPALRPSPRPAPAGTTPPSSPPTAPASPPPAPAGDKHTARPSPAPATPPPTTATPQRTSRRRPVVAVLVAVHHSSPETGQVRIPPHGPSRTRPNRTAAHFS